MLRISLVMTTAFIVGLLCTGSAAEEIEEPCTAEDPLASPYYQIIFQKDLLWRREDSLPSYTQNIRIGVWFLDGSERQRKDVKKFANYWNGRDGAPIEWVFDNRDRHHIRITFATDLNR